MYLGTRRTRYGFLSNVQPCVSNKKRTCRSAVSASLVLPCLESHAVRFRDIGPRSFRQSEVHCLGWNISTMFFFSTAVFHTSDFVSSDDLETPSKLSRWTVPRNSSGSVISRQKPVLQVPVSDTSQSKRSETTQVQHQSRIIGNSEIEKQINARLFKNPAVEVRTSSLRNPEPEKSRNTLHCRVAGNSWTHFCIFNTTRHNISFATAITGTCFDVI